MLLQREGMLERQFKYNVIRKELKGRTEKKFYGEGLEIVRGGGTICWFCRGWKWKLFDFVNSS